MSLSPESSMEFNHEQKKQTLMVSDITTQVVPDIHHTTHSSPSVVDHPDEEKLEEKKFQLEEADELALHRLLNDFDGGAEKEYHSFEHVEPPPGFRFSPTDIDLVMHYLIRKVLNHPLPWNRIVDVQLYDHSPEWLAEEYKQCGQKNWYFFTPRERKYRNGKHPNRAAGDGYWKATGTDTAIKFKELVVGYKKKLVFYRGKAPKGDKTNWIMNEYRINHPPVTKTSETDMRLDKWVLCMIYQKNESKSSKTHTQKAYPTSSHANDRNEPMKNVDMKIVEVLDFINQSYPNVPAFAHMHVSRFPNGFRAMASKYGTLPHDNITTSFPNLFQTVASNCGTLPHDNITSSFPNLFQTLASNYGTPNAHTVSNFHNQFQGVASNHETAPQMVEPFYSRHPLLHSTELNAMVGNYETSIKKGEPNSNMPTLGHSSFSTNESNGFMPSTSVFATNEWSRYMHLTSTFSPNNTGHSVESSGYQENKDTSKHGDYILASDPKFSNNYQIDKCQKLSDHDHNPCK